MTMVCNLEAWCKDIWVNLHEMLYFFTPLYTIFSLARQGRTWERRAINVANKCTDKYLLAFCFHMSFPCSVSWLHIKSLLCGLNSCLLLFIHSFTRYLNSSSFSTFLIGYGWLLSFETLQCSIIRPSVASVGWPSWIQARVLAGT